MTSPAELQKLLRFLSQDAKVPLATAMSKIKELQKQHLTSSEAISKSNAQTLQTIFLDEKLSKQIFAAAKRVSKKRSSNDETPSATTKRRKESTPLIALTPAATEATLALPDASTDIDRIAATVIHTNRAPLVLAFAVSLLQYTMPSQPMSSRLSLAQAVVSVNSRSKAVSLGLEKGKSADDEGWGQGQPVVRVMGREIKVLKRWGYNPNDSVTRGEGLGEVKPEADEDTKPPDDTEAVPATEDGQPALWGLDLEALRSSNGPKPAASSTTTGGGLPIYTAQSARAYLLKSFGTSTTTQKNDGASGAAPPKKTFKTVAQEREQNLGLLLGALSQLYSSWAPFISKDDLDRRSWQWYVQVRPDVETGVAGWGGKGQVRLASILDLRRKG